MRALVACVLFLSGLPSAGNAATLLCVRVRAGEREASIPVGAQSELRMTFSNSVYDSMVEETFGVSRDGLTPSRLFYAEPRLVEFYGHEGASYENGFWVVAPAPRRIKRLDLRVSGDATIRNSVDGQSIFIRDSGAGGANAQLSVETCGSVNDEQ